MAVNGLFRCKAPTAVCWQMIADSMFYKHQPNRSWIPRDSVVKVSSLADRDDPRGYDLSLTVNGNLRLRLTVEEGRALAEALDLAADARELYLETDDTDHL